MPAWTTPDLSGAQALAWLAQDKASTALNESIARTRQKCHLCFVHAATPALGMYPSDTLINTPQAFPGDSPSPSPAGATGTIATPPASSAPTAVPIGTGSDLGTGCPEAHTCPLWFCSGLRHQRCPVKVPCLPETCTVGTPAVLYTLRPLPTCCTRCSVLAGPSRMHDQLVQ